MEIQVEKPTKMYTSEDQMLAGIEAMKEYVKRSEAFKKSCSKKLNLLESHKSNPLDSYPIYVDIVFKLIPTNYKSFILTISLPHHWRRHQSPEDYEVALFVKHKKPENEAEEIQFKRDRDLDLHNTYDFYTKLFQEKLDTKTRSLISRIITTKEFKTEYKTHQQLDHLSKSYDLFLADAPLLMDNLNPLPRRLGRRFWARERKVPMMINLRADDLQREFDRVLFRRENFYITGRSATEKFQVGILSQPSEEICANMKCFLRRIYREYGDLVRAVNLRSRYGNYIPVFADLSPRSKVTSKFTKDDVMKKKAEIREGLRIPSVLEL